MSTHYSLVCELSSGAFGTVYLARDMANAGAMVALKVIREPINDEALQMLKNEYQIQGSLNHENIVKLIGFSYGNIHLPEGSSYVF